MTNRTFSSYAMLLKNWSNIDEFHSFTAGIVFRHLDLLLKGWICWPQDKLETQQKNEIDKLKVCLLVKLCAAIIRFPSVSTTIFTCAGIFHTSPIPDIAHACSAVNSNMLAIHCAQIKMIYNIIHVHSGWQKLQITEVWHVDLVISCIAFVKYKIKGC